jgi:hypothetical protein
MSRAPLPFAEAKTCDDQECTFCPCGATRFTLGGGRLLVNDAEVMVLHLAESKRAWAALAAGGGDGGLQPYGRVSTQNAASCFHGAGLGGFGADPALGFMGQLPEARRAREPRAWSHGRRGPLAAP